LTWAAVLQGYIECADEAVVVAGERFASFETHWYPTKRSEDMGYSGRLYPSEKTEDNPFAFRSSFGLPRVLQEVFRIGLPVANLDMHNSHYVSILDLLAPWDMDAATLFPTVQAVGTRRDEFMDDLRQAFPGRSKDDLKKQLIAIAYLCAPDAGWPQALRELHAEVTQIVRLHAERCPGDVAVARGWGVRRPEVTALASALVICSCLTTSANRCGLYLRARTR